MRGLREFRLLHATALRWGRYDFVVACPPQCAAELSGLQGVSALPIVDPAFVHSDGEARNYHGERCRRLLRYKIDVCREAVCRYGYAWCADADSIIVAPFADPLIDLLPDFAVLASPHYLSRPASAGPGIYNAGMFLTRDMDFLARWEKEMRYEGTDFGDQTAFNRVVQVVRTYDLPMRYNVGWWRHSPDAEPFKPVTCRDGVFYLETEVIFNFHLRIESRRELCSKLFEVMSGDHRTHPELYQALLHR